MKQLVVRGVDPAVVRALRARAARHGRSAEAEHRQILREVLLDQPKRSVKDHLLAMPDVGQDSDFRRSRAKARRIDL